MKDERGFTLIELLVVIAILAVLFGVTALALTGLSDGTQESMDAELDVVQTAMDICFHDSACTITAMAAGDAEQIDPADVGNYLRRTSKYWYCWTPATGQVEAVYETAADGVGCP